MKTGYKKDFKLIKKNFFFQLFIFEKNSGILKNVKKNKTFEN